MNKNIIILNGSPRKNGNTSALTSMFTKGCKEAGNIVTEFFLDEMDINGCKVSTQYNLINTFESNFG